MKLERNRKPARLGVVGPDPSSRYLETRKRSWNLVSWAHSELPTREDPSQRTRRHILLQDNILTCARPLLDYGIESGRQYPTRAIFVLSRIPSSLQSINT